MLKSVQQLQQILIRNCVFLYFPVKAGGVLHGTLNRITFCLGMHTRLMRIANGSLIEWNRHSLKQLYRRKKL